MIVLTEQCYLVDTHVNFLFFAFLIAAEHALLARVIACVFREKPVFILRLASVTCQNMRTSIF